MPPNWSETKRLRCFPAHRCPTAYKVFDTEQVANCDFPSTNREMRLDGGWPSSRAG